MHFGGGTPTFLSNEQLSALVDKIDQHFGLMRGDSVDYSIELDPREVDWPKMSLLSDLGFNRISIGVQDLNPVVQKNSDSGFKVSSKFSLYWTLPEP